MTTPNKPRYSAPIMYDDCKRSPLLTEAEAAEILGVTPDCLRGWRRKKYGPQWVRLSHRCVRYQSEDLSDWIEGQKEGRRCG